MEIYFRTTKLGKQCSDDKKRQRTFGPVRAKILKRRLDDLDAAPNLAVMFTLPGRFHALTGDRPGQFSLDLDGPYRVFLEPVLSTAEGGVETLDLATVTAVRILEIGDPHG